MKKYFLLVVMAMAFVLASCGGTNETTKVNTGETTNESGKGKNETTKVNTAEVATKPSINWKEIGKSNEGTPVYQSDVDITNIGELDKVGSSHADRTQYYTLGNVETRSANIVKAKVVKCTGQIVYSNSNPKYGGISPMSGRTKWELEVQKIYKGKLKEKQHIQIMQEYFVWVNDDGTKELINGCNQTMIKPGDEVLAFLCGKDEMEMGTYIMLCNENALFTKPSDDVIKDINTIKLTEKNMNIKRDDQGFYWDIHQKIYRDVVKKYYK